MYLLMKRNAFTILFMMLCCCIMAQVQKSVDVTKPGSLGLLLTDDEKVSITSLKISGKLNSSDVILLRQMAGAKEKDSVQQWIGKLTTLDMSDVSFVNDKKAFYVLEVGQNFKFNVNLRYKVNTINAKTGESRVMTREKYIEDRDFSNENGSLSRRLAYNDPNRKQNNIERNPDTRKEFVMKNMDDQQWSEIVRRGWNEREDYVIKWIKNDTIHQVINHTAKNCISSCMFLGCKNLKSVVLPRNTKKIGIRAFDNCTSLEEVTIPKSVEQISTNSFRKTRSLVKVNISSDSAFPQFQKIDTEIVSRYFKDSPKDIVISRE